MGGKIDNKINDRKRPYVFKKSRQNYHQIGTLLLITRNKPACTQLYIYNTQNEINNKIASLSRGGVPEHIDPNIIAQLTKMLDINNPLIQSFQVARGKLKNDLVNEFQL